MTNTGGDTALNTTITQETVHALSGLTVTAASPALPASYGNIAPSQRVTKRLFFNLSGSARFSVALTLSLKNASGATLSTSYATAVFAPAP